jgi:hypothetical protein
MRPNNPIINDESFLQMNKEGDEKEERQNYINFGNN